jgi:hypothetical protein
MFTTTPVFDGIKGKIKYEVLVFHLELRAGVNLIPFGIRSQSCFLILPASESLINHA